MTSISRLFVTNAKTRGLHIICLHVATKLKINTMNYAKVKYRNNIITLLKPVHLFNQNLMAADFLVYFFANAQWLPRREGTKENFPVCHRCCFSELKSSLHDDIIPNRKTLALQLYTWRNGLASTEKLRSNVSTIKWRHYRFTGQWE